MSEGAMLKIYRNIKIVSIIFDTLSLQAEQVRLHLCTKTAVGVSWVKPADHLTDRRAFSLSFTSASSRFTRIYRCPALMHHRLCSDSPPRNLSYGVSPSSKRIYTPVLTALVCRAGAPCPFAKLFLGANWPFSFAPDHNQHP